MGAARWLEQFSRHLTARLTNHECSVEVFNSSVENHVEKAHAKIETARQHEAYCSLHKFCAEEAFGKLDRADLAVSGDTFLKTGISSKEFPEWKELRGKTVNTNEAAVRV